LLQEILRSFFGKQILNNYTYPFLFISMCGIAGAISFKNQPVDAEVIFRMTDTLVHRGPDGEGFLLAGPQGPVSDVNRPVVFIGHRQNLAFGHRRLSIVDLAPEAGQPMTESTGRYWIVFNGEIYNHLELRTILKNKGYSFKTDHSDTEVILNAFACWGIDCLQKFNGMWAFCIWDKVEETFFFSRDRAGKKPLYYTEHKGVFYFASELKAILTNREIQRTLDDSAVYDYLTFMTAPAPGTIFTHIHKLPAGHYMTLKADRSTFVKRYWSPITARNYLDTSEAEICKGIRDRIYESARLRMLADVEVGVLLSGGLDSSINLACLSHFATKPIRAFSVGFENKDGYKNEFHYARMAAAHFKAEYHELTLTEKDFFDFYPEMVYYQDEPIADTANIPIYYIAKAARERNVKVLLGGEGSDELFVGYQHWTLARRFSQVFKNRPVLAELGAFVHASSPAKNRRPLYHGWYDKVRHGEPVFWSGTELRTEDEKRQMLSKEFADKIGTYRSSESVKRLYEEFERTGRDEYDWMTVTDLQYRLPDLLLARLDRMLMAASVEGRNPFLDVNLIEYAMSIPPDMKAKKGQEKYILKKAFEGILPDEIIYRKKDSFTVPLNRLFSKGAHLDRSIEEITSFNNATNIFSSAFIDKLGKAASSAELWNISNLAMWYNRYSA
jgi:asparagine synthase (glutamine-hydrolysing)